MGVLRLIAVAEGAAGVVAAIVPALVARALFGVEISGAGLVMTRITGCALIGLAVACWPTGGVASKAALRGMLLYSALAAICLAVSGRVGLTGPLLWPGVATHVAFVLVLARPVVSARGTAPVQ